MQEENVEDLRESGGPYAIDPILNQGQDQSASFQSDLCRQIKSTALLSKVPLSKSFHFTIKLQIFIAEFYNPCKSSDIN